MKPRGGAAGEGVQSGEHVEAVEPLAADVRPRAGESSRYRKRMARLRIVAALLGCDFDELRRRDQERRTRNLITAGVALAALSIVLLALSLCALYQEEPGASCAPDERGGAFSLSWRGSARRRRGSLRSCGRWR